MIHIYTLEIDPKKIVDVLEGIKAIDYPGVAYLDAGTQSGGLSILIVKMNCDPTVYDGALPRRFREIAGVIVIKDARTVKEIEGVKVE